MENSPTGSVQPTTKQTIVSKLSQVLKQNPKLTKAVFFVGVILILAVVSIAGYLIINSNQIQLPAEKIEGEIILPKDLVDSNKAIADYQTSVGGATVTDSQPIPGRFAFKFAAGKTETEIAAYVTSIGGKILKKSDQGGFYLIQVPDDFKADSVDKAIVASTDQDVTVMPTQATYAPNDPLLNKQWALTRMAAPAAWANLPQITHPYKQTTVAVIDTGACFTHPDMVGVYTNTGYDFYDMDNDPTNVYDHGCMVAGVIAAVQNNAVGITGIAPAVKVIPYKMYGETAGGSAIAAVLSIYDAVEKGANVINMSFGSTYAYQPMQDALNYAAEHGVTSVAAAGNNGNNKLFYPAAFANVIAVGSVDQNPEKRSWFSNFGSYVDAWAPGSNILTTSLNGGYKTVSGTSLSSPYVAGLIALEKVFCRDLEIPAGVTSVKAHAEKAFDLNSCYPNQAPVVTSTAPSTITAGSAFSYQLTVTDGNGDTLTYTLANEPTGMIVNAAGMISWPTPVAGTYTVTAKVSDRIATTEQAFSLKVNPKPVAPVLRTPKAPQVFTNGEAEYAAWKKTVPSTTICAATEMSVVSKTKGNFEIWACTSLNSTTMLGIQVIMDDQGIHATSDQLPVKYRMPDRTKSTPYGTYPTRFINANGFIWGHADLINPLMSLGWP